MSPQNPGLAVNIRGFEGSGRVNTMIDGVRQNFRFTGHEAQGFTYIDPSLVAGIDIARGAVSTAGGAGALAGAANFRTLDVEDILKPGQTMGGLTSLTWGTNEVGFSEMGAAAATSGGVGIAGAISRREPNNYENGDGETIPFTFQDLNSGLFKVNFQLNDEQSLRFGGVFYDNDFFANSYFQNVNSKTFTAKYAYKPVDNDLIDFRLNGYRNDVVMKYDTDSTPTLGGTAPTARQRVGPRDRRRRLGLRRFQRVALQSRQRARQVGVWLRVLQRRRQRLQSVPDAAGWWRQSVGRVRRVRRPSRRRPSRRASSISSSACATTCTSWMARALSPTVNSAAAGRHSRSLHGRQVRWKVRPQADACRASARLAAALRHLFGIVPRPDHLRDADGRHPSRRRRISPSSPIRSSIPRFKRVGSSAQT